jgi:DNA invertase Pin-like site-specific DNA recombinase
MKAIGYIRVSTQGQAEDGVSLDAQEAKLRAWAALNDAELVIFRDEGVSGKRSDNRPGLQAALEMVGKGDALVCYSLSRLSRSTKDTLAMAETLAKKDANLVSLSEKVDTTSASGKMVFRLLAVLAEFERDQVSDRTRMALAHKKANGEKTGGDVPFGFSVQDGRLYRDAKEQDTIRLVMGLRKQGKSYRAIGRLLEADGVTTKTGARIWHAAAVRRIVTGGERVALPSGSQDSGTVGDLARTPSFQAVPQ